MNEVTNTAEKAPTASQAVALALGAGGHVYHVQAGAADWTPTLPELQELADSFAGILSTSAGGYHATRADVYITALGTAQTDRVVHVVAGDDAWMPTTDDLREIVGAFVAADNSETGGVVVTRAPMHVNIVLDAGEGASLDPAGHDADE